MTNPYVKAIAILYLLGGIFTLLEKIFIAKKDFEERYIPKCDIEQKFSRKIEISVVYKCPNTNKMYRMGIDLNDAFYNIFYWPVYIFK